MLRGRIVGASGVVLLLLCGVGCAPEILSVSPTRVGPDDEVVVRVKHIRRDVEVVLGGGPVPVSDVRITQKKNNVGRFAFRMPLNDAAGRPLEPGKQTAEVRIGRRRETIELDYTGLGKAPVPRVEQQFLVHGQKGNSFAADLQDVLWVTGFNLRWPLKIRLDPIAPHGEPFEISFDNLNYNERSRLELRLPPATIQLASFRVSVTNSPRYGGEVSERAVAVYAR